MATRKNMGSSKTRNRKTGSNATNRLSRWIAWPLILMAVSGAAYVGWTVEIPELEAKGDAFVQAVAEQTGLTLGSVEISGHSRTSIEEIEGALPIGPGEPIFGFSLEAAQQNLEALPWVSTARLARRLPDALVVEIVERQPFAIWQVDGRHELIDESGQVISGQSVDAFAHLPIVVGAQAADDGRDLFAILEGHAEFAKQVKAAIRIGGRRWDIELENGVRVSLPATSGDYTPVLAWSRFVSLVQDEDLLAKDITRIDLRLPDRVVLGLSDEARKQMKSDDQRT